MTARRPRSVRARVTLAAALIALVPLLLGAVVTALAVRAALTRDAEDRTRAALTQAGAGAGSLDSLDDVLRRTRTPDLRMAVLSRVTVADFPDSPLRPTRLSPWPFADPAEQYSLYYVGLADGRTAEPVVVRTELAGQQRRLNGVVLGLAGGVLLLAALVAATTWVVAGRMLDPVEEIRREVADITAHNLDRRVAVPTSDDELARLARTMNATLDRLQVAVDQQRRFVADASHELRGPLAGLRAELEIALAHPHESPLPEVVRRALADTGRLQRLTTELLLLARLDADPAGSPGTTGEPVDLAALARLRVAARRPRAGRAVAVRAGPAPLLIAGREALLVRLPDNLLDNAERHAERQVTVTVRGTGASVVLEVLDDGAGIPVADRENVFDRFTRLDEARDRDSGGAGLGLAISRRIAAVHGGTLGVGGSVTGARLVARLPRWPDPAASELDRPIRTDVPARTPPTGRTPTRARRPDAGRAGTAAKFVAVAVPVVLCAGSTTIPAAVVGARFDAALTSTVRPSTAGGGTLRLGLADRWTRTDPGNMYDGFGWNLSRLYSRGLTTFRSVPGSDAVAVVPDLATELGTVLADRRTVVYHLRPGATFDDGSPVRSTDVKYGIERSNYAKDVLPNGPSHLRRSLTDAAYPGPYRDRSPDRLGLRAIGTPDPLTVVFHLAQPFSELDSVLALPEAAPVPRARDAGRDYARHVASTGPYRFAGATIGSTIVLERNPRWDPTADPNRRQLPDRIEVITGLTQFQLDERLLSGDLDLDVTGHGVGADAQARILSRPELKQHADLVPTGLRYLSVSARRGALRDVHCRRAVHHLLDRGAVQAAYGGPIVGGATTSTVLSGVADPGPAPQRYSTGVDGRGDVAAARQELARCGRPDGFATALAVRDRPDERAVADALRRQLAAGGIRVTIRVFPEADYFRSYAGNPKYAQRHDLGLAITGWAADWPGPIGFLQPLVDGRAITGTENFNLAELDDGKVNGLLDAANRTTDPAARQAVARRVERAVLDSATIAPLVVNSVLLYRSPRLTNVRVTRAYGGGYDYALLGVR